MPQDLDPTSIAKVRKDPTPVPAADTQVQLQFLPVDQLVIDARYQRKMSRGSLAQARRIVAAFTWSRFGALTVSRQDNGFAVTDGQHRLFAARALGITHVPAVISVGEVADQAKDFVGINAVRTSVAAIDKFRARVAAQDPAALIVHDLLTNLEISTDVAAGTGLKHKETRAVVVLEKLANKIGRGELFTTLELILDSQPDQPNLLTAFTIEATALTVSRVIAGKGDLDRLLRVMRDTDFETLKDNATQMVKLTGGNTRHRGHELLLQTYNKGLQAKIG